MRTVKLLTAIAVAALMTGCVPSIHPLYTEKDLVFDRALLGVWVSGEGDGDKTTWTFTKSGKNAYSMVSADDGEPARFEAKLVRLGDQLYLDILPVEAPVENDFYRSLLIRAHAFAKIRIDKETLSVALMDPDWLKKQGSALAQQGLADGGVLLTASTQELQEFILKHGSDPALFGEPETFRRRHGGD